MARKKESANFATEIISMVKRRLIICRIALAVSLAGNVIMAAMLICRQSRHGAAGIILLPFSFTGLVLLPAQHIICRNVGKCWHIPLQANRAAVMQDSCKQWHLVGYSHNAGSFATRYGRGEMLQKVAQKRARRSMGKFRKMRENANKKRNFLTRYAQERKTLIFRAKLNQWTR